MQITYIIEDVYLEYIKLSKKTNNPKPPRKRKSKETTQFKNQARDLNRYFSKDIRKLGRQADEETLHIIIQRNVN